MEDIQEQIKHWNDGLAENAAVNYRMVHNPDRCVQCGLCVAFCPCYVLETGEEGTAQAGYPVFAHPEKCVGCTTCAGNCPQRALSIEALTDVEYDPFADESHAEPISAELQQQYAEWQRIITEKLDLRWQPVA